MKVSEKQHVQRTWGSTRPGMLGKQQGGSCAWSRVRHGRRRGQAVQSCVGHGEDLGFYHSGDGSPGGLQAEIGPDSGAHRRSLLQGGLTVAGQELCGGWGTR